MSTQRIAWLGKKAITSHQLSSHGSVGRAITEDILEGEGTSDVLFKPFIF